MVPVGKIFSKSWNYSLNWRRITPFFLLLVPYVVLFAAFADSALGFFAKYGVAPAAGSMPVNFAFELALFFMLLIFVSAVVFFADMYARGVIIENSRAYYLGKKASLMASKSSFGGRFLNLFCAVVVTRLILFGLGMVPFVGWIFTIALSWAFLVVLQSVVVSKNSAIDSIKDSYEVFMARKLDTFVFWLLLGLISAVMTFAAFIPFIMAAWPLVASFLSFIVTGSAPSFIDLVRQNIAQIFAGGIASAFFLGFVQVFKESATTFFFMEAKKKRR